MKLFATVLIQWITSEAEMKIKKDWKLSEEQGQISIEIDRTLQEQMRLKVDKEIKSGGFYNVENSTGKRIGIYFDLLL